MAKDPENGGQEGPEHKGDSNKPGVSRRGLFSVLKGVGAGIGAAVILGRDTITALAQQVTGVAGSAGATTTIPGNQIPPPPPEFGGVIKERASESTPWWPPRVVPPKGAPNVLLIMTDDVGFAAPSTFGGVIPTPALDRIAAHGAKPGRSINPGLRGKRDCQSCSGSPRRPSPSSLWILCVFFSCWRALKSAYGIHRTHDLRCSRLGRRPNERNR